MAPVLLCWSGGKDSARCLAELLAVRADVVGLLTTVTTPYDRISMHGVRRVLLERQARALGRELATVELPVPCSNEIYEERMAEALAPWIERGVEEVAFGDIFLEDLKRYREERLAPVGLRARFPIWGRDTGELAREFVDAGFRAVVTCVDPKVLDGSFAGRLIDRAFLADLPEGVDPCGENGEFHSFVVDGPIFAEPVACEVGEVVERDGFVFCDLVPPD